MSHQPFDPSSNWTEGLVGYPFRKPGLADWGFEAFIARARHSVSVMAGRVWRGILPGGGDRNHLGVAACSCPKGMHPETFRQLATNATLLITQLHDPHVQTPNQWPKPRILATASVNVRPVRTSMVAPWVPPATRLFSGLHPSIVNAHGKSLPILVLAMAQDVKMAKVAAEVGVFSACPDLHEMCAVVGFASGPHAYLELARVQPQERPADSAVLPNA